MSRKDVMNWNKLTGEFEWAKYLAEQYKSMADEIDHYSLKVDLADHVSDK